MLPTWTAPLPDPNKPLGGYTQVLRLHTPHTKRTGNACAMKVNMQPNRTSSFFSFSFFSFSFSSYQT